MKRQQGFALVAVLVLAVLYFGVMELALLEAQAAHRTALRYRSRVVAQVAAENACEIVSHDLLNRFGERRERHEDAQSTAEAELMRWPSGNVEIEATATSKGVNPITVTVRYEGRVEGSGVEIRASEH